jgi:CBS domain-containing protein
MEEIVRFLAEHPPFADLSAATLNRIAGSIQIEYFVAGQEILHQGGKPAQFLYLIRRGSVELIHRERTEPLDTLGVGELFGFVSLIREAPPIVTVRACEETLAYLIPLALFRQLRREELSFTQFFARSITERLDAALRHARGAAPTATVPELFQTRLGDLARRPVVAIPPEATVREAAQQMRDAGVSCLLVDLPPYGVLDQDTGIVTDRDLRNRVLADGLPDTTPVAAIMSVPARSLPAESLVFEGLLHMLEHGIHHLPVSEQGLLVGMVTFSDVMRQQSRSPLLLPGQLRRARNEAELRQYADKVAESVGALLDAGARVSDIGRMVAVAYDALQVHILRLAEAELGPPPCPYAWLVLGSGGRYEQTLRTDQDNALVYADNAPPEAEIYFARLAEMVVLRLVACGFPRCPGNIMATNSQWRRPLADWQGYFRRWIDVPDEEALLAAAIFFDFRQVYGELDLAVALRPILASAREQRVFLGRMARAALRHTAPLGLFRQLVLERQGNRRDLLDLKLRGVGMIVGLARLFGLEAGSTATTTLTRLRDAVTHSSLDATTAEELIAAFELFSLLRLRHQRRQIGEGLKPDNLLALAELTPLERREVKEAIRVVERAQRGVEMTFQTGMIS